MVGSAVSAAQKNQIPVVQMEFKDPPGGGYDIPPGGNGPAVIITPKDNAATSTYRPGRDK